jgi:hypothetical protein
MSENQMFATMDFVDEVASISMYKTIEGLLNHE